VNGSGRDALQTRRHRIAGACLGHQEIAVTDAATRGVPAHRPLPRRERTALGASDAETDAGLVERVAVGDAEAPAECHPRSIPPDLVHLDLADLDPSLLEYLIRTGEPAQVERNEQLPAAERLGSTIAAMANGSGGWL
jgi:hypothetical protein